MAKSKKSFVTRALVVTGSVITLAILAILGQLNLDLPSFSTATEEATESTNEELIEQADRVEVESRSSQLLTSVDELNESSEDRTFDSTADPTLPVDVVIDGDKYLVESVTQAGRSSVQLPQVVAAVQNVEGDDQGIKIRVRRTFDATAEAEDALLAALAENGISDDEIDFRRQLIDLPASD